MLHELFDLPREVQIVGATWDYNAATIRFTVVGGGLAADQRLEPRYRKKDYELVNLGGADARSA